MEQETLKTYISSERVRGIPDAMIRAELLKTGWKEHDVDEMLSGEVKTSPPASISTPASSPTGHSPEGISTIFLRIGMALFLLASVALLMFGPGLDSGKNSLFLVFALTHVVNAVAAYFLFVAILRLSRSVLFRIWIVFLALFIASFAALSFLHFISIGTGSDLFDLLQRGLLGDDYLPLIIYFMLLPLQAVVFLVLAVTLWGLRAFRRHKKQEKMIIRPYMQLLGVFFALAILALGDLFLVLNNSHFGF